MATEIIGRLAIIAARRLFCSSIPATTQPGLHKGALLGAGQLGGIPSYGCRRSSAYRRIRSNRTGSLVKNTTFRCVFCRTTTAGSATFTGPSHGCRDAPPERNLSIDKDGRLVYQKVRPIGLFRPADSDILEAIRKTQVI